MHAKIYMSAYILDAVCAQHEFPGLEWAWSPVETIFNTYFKLFSECSFRGVIIRLFNHFLAPVYMLIFEQDPPYMLKEAMEALLSIAYWYASPSSTYIRMFSVEKPPHVLLNFSSDILFMQEVAYISQQDWQLDYSGRRRNLGPLFHYRLGYTRSGVSRKQMSK